MNTTHTSIQIHSTPVVVHTYCIREVYCHRRPSAWSDGWNEKFEYSICNDIVAIVEATSKSAAVKAAGYKRSKAAAKIATPEEISEFKATSYFSNQVGVHVGYYNTFIKPRA